VELVGGVNMRAGTKCGMESDQRCGKEVALSGGNDKIPFYVYDRRFCYVNSEC
jgi:hypothetical protein